MIWGHKTEAFLDVWSIEHLVAGVSLGGACYFINKKGWLKLEGVYLILFVLCLSFAWETLEHYLEVGLAGSVVEDWFAGVEHWSNRLISDHLMVLLGLSIYIKFPLFLWPARLFSFLWLIIHIFVFPHSMYLHEIL